MAETVFILGAGASRESGAPLMSDFFDVMERVIEGNQDQTLKDALHAVIRAVVDLESSAARINVDTNNVESILGLFEMARLIDTPILEGNADRGVDLVILWIGSLPRPSRGRSYSIAHLRQGQYLMLLTWHSST